MEIDDELDRLEDGLRRLKIEFEAYFNGGSPRPPNDTQWRVENLLKKYSDSSRMSFAQRFRYTGMAQRYGMYSELWRRRVRNREEGPRKTSFDLRAEHKTAAPAPFRVGWSDPSAEPEKVDQLFSAFLAAKKKAGEDTDKVAAESFKRFVKEKTEQLKRELKCEQVEYIVEVKGGQVRLKAKGL